MASTEDLPHILRVPRSDYVDSTGDILPYVVINVAPAKTTTTSSGDDARLLGSRIIATDGQEVYICDVTQTLVDQAWANSGSRDEWPSILSHCLFEIDPHSSKIGASFSGVDLTAAVDGMELRLSIRKQIGGITQRLGLITIPASVDESAEAEADVLSWAASACEWVSIHRNRTAALQAELAERTEMVQKLRREMDDLVSRNQELVDGLLEKFSRVLNSKKRFIRERLAERGGRPLDAGSPPADDSAKNDGDDDAKSEAEPVPVSTARGRGTRGRGRGVGRVATSTRGGRKPAAPAATKPPSTRPPRGAAKRKRPAEAEESSAEPSETDADEDQATDLDYKTDSGRDDGEETDAGNESGTSSPVISRPARRSNRIATSRRGGKISEESSPPAAPVRSTRSRGAVKQATTTTTATTTTAALPEVSDPDPTPVAEKVAPPREDRMDIDPVFIPPRRELPFQKKAAAKASSSKAQPKPAVPEPDDQMTDEDEL